MNLNVELLEAVKRRIMSDPMNFEIGATIENTACGTVACVAGHAVLEHLGDEQGWETCGNKKMIYDAGAWSRTRELAIEILRIDGRQTVCFF
ncbi:MAG: hypothetical protein WBB28_20680 [Crinalium sp.]